MTYWNLLRSSVALVQKKKKKNKYIKHKWYKHELFFIHIFISCFVILYDATFKAIRLIMKQHYLSPLKEKHLLDPYIRVSHLRI